MKIFDGVCVCVFFLMHRYICILQILLTSLIFSYKCKLYECKNFWGVSFVHGCISSTYNNAKGTTDSH